MTIDYSTLRKQLQESKEAPPWFTTGGTQLFYEKYSYKNETPKARFKTIARALAAHAPAVYPDWWEADSYTAGKTYSDVMFEVMWDGLISASTPLLANGGLRKRGTTVSCLTGESLILTKQGGVKQIKDITIGDEVLTHKGRWRGVTATQSRMSDHDLYSLSVDTRNTPIKITGNHPVLTNEGWIKVEDLNPVKHLIATNSTIEYKEEPHSIVLGSDIDFGRVKYGVCTKTTMKVEVDEDLAWALGLWFAEGSLNIRKDGSGSNGRVIRITMSQEEVPYLERFGNTMKSKFGVNYDVAMAEHNGDKWATCTVSSVYLANYFGNNFGKSCLTKTIPREIIEMPRNLVEQFLRGVYQGDGRKSAGKKEFTPDIRLSNEYLIAQLYEMSLKIDMEVSLQLAKLDGRNDKNPVSSLVYFNGGFIKPTTGERFNSRGIFFSGNRYCKFTLGEVEQDEMVYDITVDEDESFSVAGVVVHNCAGGYVGNNLYDRYNAITEAAILTKHSHGTSYSIDHFPHEGAELKRGGNSLGVMPLVNDFISCMNEVTQASRRGSLAYSIRPQHGDFEKVLNNLYENTESNNVGWLIDDEFIEALKNKDKVAISKLSKTLGVKLPRGKGYYTFIDKMNRHLAPAFKRKGMTLKASNLCQETCLPADENYTFSCVILNYNLEHYRKFPAHLYWIGQIMSDCNISEYLATMDEMSDIDKEAMKKIYRFTKEFRALGSGVMGLHTLFQKERLVIGHLDTMFLNREIFGKLDADSLLTTKWLAEVMGEPEGCKGLGIRNATRLMMPPTKSTAEIMAGASEGIGLDTAMVFTKQSAGGEFFRINKVLLEIMKDKGVYNDETIRDIIKNKGSVQHVGWLSEHERQVFRTAFEVRMEDYLRLCSARQKYIDQAQSINLYFTSNDSEEYISEIHRQAFEDEGILSLYYIYSMRGAGNITRVQECEVCQ